MKRFLSTAGLALVLASACVSCDKINPPQPELKKSSTVTEPAVQQENERAAFVQAAQKELDELRAVIAEFKAKADAANLQSRARLAIEVENLEAELRETQQRLLDLKSATLDSWSQLKQPLGNSLEKLKNGMESLRKNAS